MDRNLFMPLWLLRTGELVISTYQWKDRKYWRKTTEITKALYLIAKEWKLLVFAVFQFGFSVSDTFFLPVITLSKNKETREYTLAANQSRFNSQQHVWFSELPRHHVPSLLLPCMVAGAYTVARDAVLVEKIKWKLTRCLLAVTGWGVWKKKVSFTPSCENKCLDGWVTVEGAEKKWMWADRGRGIWHICLKLIAITFRTNSRGALSMAFGQFTIAYTPHLGSRRQFETVSGCNNQSNLVVIHQTHGSWQHWCSAIHLPAFCLVVLPITLLTGMHIESKIKTHNAQPS